MLAVVAGGLYLSTRRNEMFDAATRTHAVPVWRNFIFILNGLVFALIGLDLPQILEGLQREGVSLVTATGYGLLVTAVLIVVRIFASYGAALVTMVMKNFIEVADDKYPGNGAPLVIGWAGMRGVVSLRVRSVYPDNGGRAGVPAPRSHTFHHLCGDLGDACDAGADTAATDKKGENAGI